MKRSHHEHRKPRQAKQADRERPCLVLMSAVDSTASPPRIQPANRRAPEIALELDREHRPTIAELEALLAREDLSIAINPDGSITAVQIEQPTPGELAEKLGVARSGATY